MKQSVITCIILISIFALLPRRASAQWTQGGALSPSNYTVSCLASVGANIFAGTYGGGVYISGDNSGTWTSANANLPSGLNVNAFAEYENLVLVAATNKGIYATSNNGALWLSLNTGLPSDMNDSAVIIFGNDIYVGTDSGVYTASFTNYTWYAVNTGFPVKDRVTAFAVNNGNLFAATWGAGVYMFNTGTTSWTAVNSTSGQKDSLPGTPHILSLTSNGKEMLASTSDLYVYSTSNNGAMWMKADTGFSIYTGALPTLFAIGSDFLAGGNANESPGTENPTIYLTTNNGSAWTTDTVGFTEGTTASFVYSFCANSQYVFAGTYGQGVWRLPISDIPSAVNEQAARQPAEFTLAQNYPNPFSATTLIAYNLQEPEVVSLTIYNALGEQVASLVNAEQGTGAHSVDFNGANLHNGVYYYRLTAGMNSQTGMMNVVR